jgi:hypothetical protein
LSSTTETPRDRGQILVIFGLSLFTIIVVAALAFDTGLMLLERRDEQNASDAASLAAARHLPEDPNCISSPSLANCPRAHAAALALGTANGYTDGVDSEDVFVHIPPQSGLFQGQPGFVEVIIQSNRPSIFGGIIGTFGWEVSARAVAANQPGLDLPFSMLTLDPSSCAALKVTGSGVVESAGTVQVNSSCAPNALDVGGLGVLTVTAEGATCNVVGEIDRHGANSELNCTQAENSYAIQDPLRNLEAPPVPGYPAAIEQVSGTPRNVPSGCPGSASPATAEDPVTCNFGGAYDGKTYRVYPGYYPGGLNFGKGTFLLMPGTYYIGGGGFRAANGNVCSVESVDELDCATFGGGVLVYNTEAYEFEAECAAGTATDPAAQCIAAVVLNGGTTGVNLMPLNDGSDWDGLVIFQDRDLNVSLADPSLTDVQINGGGSTMEVAGTIYVPSGDVVTNGSGGTLTLDQVIGWSFQINGDGGTIEIEYRSGVTAHVSGVGLVE